MQLTDKAKETIRGQAKEELRTEAVRVIKTWGLAFGVTNVVALLASLVYVFGFLPSQAAVMARTQLNLEIAELKNKVIEESTAAIMKVGEVRGKALLVKEELDKTHKDLDTIKSEVAVINAGKRKDLASLIGSLNASPTAQEILARVEKVDGSLSDFKGAFTHTLVPNSEWSWSTTSNNWETVGALSSVISLGSDTTLVLVANGHTKKDHKDEYLYLSFFVDEKRVPSPPVTPAGLNHGPYLNYHSGEWMMGNFTQIFTVRGLQYPADVRVELKMKTNPGVTSTCAMNGASIQILTLPAGSA